MVTSPESRSFGRHVVKVELATVLSNPFGRPVGWMLLLGALPTSALVWSWIPPLPPVITGLVAYLIALLILSVIYRLVAPGVDARAFDAAPYRWLEPIADGHAGAFARPDRRGRLTLYSVWADPRGRGLGSVLMAQVIADTEPFGDLWLVAVNKRAADFYSRHGFRRVRRELLGHRMVLERVPPASTALGTTEGDFAGPHNQTSRRSRE